MHDLIMNPRDIDALKRYIYRDRCAARSMPRPLRACFDFVIDALAMTMD